MNNKKALEIYAMDYKYWKSQNAAKHQEGDEAYKKWYFEKADRVDLPDDVYEEVFQNTFYYNQMAMWVFDKKYHLFVDSKDDEHIYFNLPYTFFLRETGKVDSSVLSPQVRYFSNFLKKIESHELKVIVKFDKKSNWFAYDEYSKKIEQSEKENEKRLDSMLLKRNQLPEDEN
jgi:hypothetical protein